MSDKKPDLKRDNTMKITAKEGERYLQEVWKLQKSTKNEDSSDSTKPKLSKHTTMLQTKKEGESYVAAKGGGIDDDVKTRNQQDKIDKILEEPLAKKAKAMDEQDEDKQKPSVKRISTTVRTAKEGEELLKELGHKDDQPDADRRRTRSQTRGVPIPPPTPKRERKPVKDTSKNDVAPKGRGRGRPKKEEKKDEKSENSLEDTAEENQNVSKEVSKEEDDDDDEEEEEEEDEEVVHENENGGEEVEDMVEGKTPSKLATSETTVAEEDVTEDKN